MTIHTKLIEKNSYIMQQIVQEDLAAKAAAEEKKKKRLRTGIKWDRLFMACAYNWYWFVLSMIVCASIA